jgi:methylated-DNA-protein-cysteine methyltransferase related protein
MREHLAVPDRADGPRDFDHAVAAVVQDVPKGTVVSYGWVALEAGYPGAARAVGRLLAQSPAPLPWWRVTRADGAFAPPVARRQAELLRAEGVAVHGGRTDARPLTPPRGKPSGG